MSTTGDLADALSKMVEEALDTAGKVADAARTYLGTEQGREMRHKVATAVIVGLPLLSELPAFADHPWGGWCEPPRLGRW